MGKKVNLCQRIYTILKDHMDRGLMKKTCERLLTDDRKRSRILFCRHLTVYEHCVSLVKGKRVLDLGCSDGYGSFLLSRKAKKVVGMDIDHQAINLAVQKYQSRNLSFLVADALKISRMRKFDLVISLQLIEHISDTDSYLNQIKKILKKGGKAIFSTPNKQMRLAKGEKPWNPFHVREYDLLEFQRVLAEHFSKVTILGLQATPEIYKIEKKRLYLRRMIAKIDVFRLYQHFPREIADWLLGRFKKKIRQVSSSDFWVSQENMETSLDFIALCET